jgi:hypothetical protein
MFDFDCWQAVNEQYLTRSLAWLRARLEAAAKSDATDPTEREEDAPSVDGEYQPALEVLAARFGLSDFEKRVLLLCAAMEFDTRTAGLCAAAHGDPAKPFPTASLCFSLFCDGAWDVLSPERPLRQFRLIEIDRQPYLPLTASPLRVDERIVSYMKGLNYLDERLALMLSPLEIADRPPLPPSQQAVADRIVSDIQAGADPVRGFPVIQLLGADCEDKRTIAADVAERLGLQLYRITADLIPQSIDELDTFARLWQRECRLVPLGLYVDVSDGVEKHSDPAVRRFLTRLSGITFCDIRDLQPGLDGRSVVIDVAKPTSAEQCSAWCARLPATAADTAQQLAGQFDLNLAAIDRITETVHDAHFHDPSALAQHLWQGCRENTRPRMDQLAQRVDFRATWEDIVLPDDELGLLRQVASQVRHRGKVLDEWGFRNKMNRGLGVTALFAGESGTGKTMAAEVIANDLQLDLYRIDLSSVINKYIGETEKNLRRLFDAAEDGGAILFFDEADALFGKRSEVKDSHDRFANIEVNYLLQRMESYRGLAILATNNKKALDTAFLRRLRFIIDFRFPDTTQRKQIWRRIFPEQTPISGLDHNHLAKLRLTGGNIYNIALNAAFTAARERPHVDMRAILNATKAEMIKTQKPLNVGDFQWAGVREAIS